MKDLFTGKYFARYRAVLAFLFAVLILALTSCAGGAGDDGGDYVAEEETSNAAPAVTETCRYTVDGVTYVIMSNGTVTAYNSDGTSHALANVTVSSDGKTFYISDEGKSLVIATADGGAATITVTDTSGTRTLHATSGGTATAVTRTVSFVTNGGTSIADIEVPDSNAAVLPNATGKSTWDFYRWYTDSSLTTAYNTATPVTENMTLYAVWARSYTIDGVTYSVLSNGKVVNASGSEIANASVSSDFNTVSFTDGGKSISITISGSTTTATVTEGGNTRIFTDNGSGGLSAVMRTVTFDSKGGSSVASVTVADGTGITAPASTPTKQGYTFAGWCTDSSATVAYSFGTPVTGNMTLYAKWTEESVTYTVKHLQQNVTGSGYTEVTADRQSLGGTTGTQTNATAKTYTGFTAQSITQQAIAADSSTVVEIKYNRNSITHTFKANGGNWSGSTADKPVTVLYGADLTPPGNPARTGYTFAGWYTDSSLTNAYSSGAATENKTLYAKWSAGSVTYTVKHLLQDVSGSGYTEVTADSQTLGGTTGAQTAATAKTYTGFTAQGITQKTIASDSSTVVEVKYDRNNITYTFNANGGNWSGSTANKTVSGLYGASVSKPANPTKTGYTFSAWSSTVPTTFGASNATFTASWTAASVAYTVKHLQQNMNGSGYTEVTGDRQSLSGTTGTQTVAAAKTYTGFTAQSITQKTIAADGSTVVEIKYNRKSITYTFNANGGNWSGSTANKTVSGLYGASVTKPANPTKTGYTFSAWGSTVPATFGAANATFTASWTANTYKVTFDKNGGSGTMSQQSFSYGTAQALTANAFTRTGYTFAGWATSASGAKAYNDKASYSIGTANVTLYAVWTANTYKVTFDKNGGSGSMSQQNFTYGTEQALTANAFTRSGYAFVGWSTTKNGAKEYNNKQSVSNLSSTNGATVTLYAKWLAIPSGFVYAEGNGTVGNLFVCDHEVTQGEYEAYCIYGDFSPNNNSYGKGTSYPAYNISWYDALVYCNKRSIAEGLVPCYTIGGSTDPSIWSGVINSGGKYCGPSSSSETWNAVTVNSSANGYRLPTEAEWLYAAKGGSMQESYTYSGSNDIDEVAWYSGNSERKSHPVKGKKKNSLGIYDMSGNVLEWCFDAIGSSFRSKRGGGASSNSSECTVSSRRNGDPSERTVNGPTGFRIVRNAN